MTRFDSLLKNKLTDSELTYLCKSLDILGEIAIIEIPQKLIIKEKIIGNAILKANPQLRAVFKKASVVKGEFRLRKLKRIAGKGNTLTTYRENNCIFKFDASKVFFTPRMSSERLRIANQIRRGEVIIDMFAGVGPFAILIAKLNPNVKRIYCIDSNKDAINYLMESAGMNKVSHKIIAFTGDSRAVIEKFLIKKATRVIMNLPKTEENFFNSALITLKNKGILHFYTFARNENDVRKKIKKQLKNSIYKIKKIKIVRQYAPRIWNFVADIKIIKIN